MSKRILAYRRLNDQQLEQLRERFHVDYFGKLESPDDPAFREALGEAHGLIGAGVTLTPALLDAAPNLEAIASISVGVDNYPVDELTRRGILLCNTPDVLTETTADTGFSLIMSTARRWWSWPTSSGAVTGKRASGPSSSAVTSTARRWAWSVSAVSARPWLAAAPSASA